MAKKKIVAFPGRPGYRGSMSTTALEVRIRPAEGRIELQRLTSTLDQLRLALSDIDRAYVYRGSRPKWVIADIRQLEVEILIRVTASASPTRPAASMLASVDALVSGVESLRHEPIVPDYYSPQTVERILTVSGPGRGIRDISLATVNGNAGKPVHVSEPVRENARRAVLGVQESLGSVAGWLDSMSARRLGSGRLMVALYDPLTRSAVIGELPSEMADEAHDRYWRRRVLASGRVKRNDSGQAVRIKIDGLELLPEDDNERAPVADLIGSDPDWLDGQSVDEYIREVRRA